MKDLETRACLPGLAIEVPEAPGRQRSHGDLYRQFARTRRPSSAKNRRKCRKSWHDSASAYRASERII